MPGNASANASPDCPCACMLILRHVPVCHFQVSSRFSLVPRICTIFSFTVSRLVWIGDAGSKRDCGEHCTYDLSLAFYLVLASWRVRCLAALELQSGSWRTLAAACLPSDYFIFFIYIVHGLNVQICWVGPRQCCCTWLGGLYTAKMQAVEGIMGAELLGGLLHPALVLYGLGEGVSPRGGPFERHTKGLYKLAVAWGHDLDWESGWVWQLRLWPPPPVLLTCLD